MVERYETAANAPELEPRAEVEGVVCARRDAEVSDVCCLLLAKPAHPEEFALYRKS
jgi:hypothetical protein